MRKLRDVLRTSRSQTTTPYAPTTRMKTREINRQGRLIKLTGLATGCGIYIGKLMGKPTTKLDPTADISDATIGTALTGSGSGSGDKDIYLVNPGEIGRASGSHWLVPGGEPTYFFAYSIGLSNDDTDNKPVFVIIDNQSDFCGTNGSGSGSGA